MMPTTPSGCFTTRARPGMNQTETDLRSGRIHFATRALACFAVCSAGKISRILVS